MRYIWVMLKNTRFIVALCAVAIAMVLLLQFYWISNYYKVNKASFEKEVNLAFEDALKKDFSLRCDTIQHLIAAQLMDTAQYRISSEFNTKYHRYQYTISDAHNLHDKFSSSFSHDSLDKPLLAGDTAFKWRIANHFALAMRSEDLEHHIIYFRTQNIGGFMTSSIAKYGFDTTRLRPVLNHYLHERDINVPYTFYLRRTDSTLNSNRFEAKLLAKYPVITKSYPTYKLNSANRYVRAMFTDPSVYIMRRMAVIFISSLILIAVVAFSLIALLRLLFKEKRLSAIKNDFISNITHEFKTPIATSLAAIEALTHFDVLNDKEKTLRYLNHSKNELDRLAALVDKVLNIAVYENQEFAIKPELFNVDEAIKNLLQNFAATPGKVINYNYKNTTGVQQLNADKLYFQHAISNIIDNGIKYSGDEVNIEVECKVDNGFFVILVKDNGIGITPHDLQLVFEKFYRVPTGRHLVKGHGLGLNYVKSIIERHRGWYKMESEYGKGSVLSLAWPI